MLLIYGIVDGENKGNTDCSDKNNGVNNGNADYGNGNGDNNK